MFSPNITARGPGILPFLELTVDLRIFPYNSPESTEEPLTQGSCYSPLPGPAPAHSWCSSNRRPDTRASPIRAFLPRCHPVTWRPGALSTPSPPPARPFLPAGPARAVPSPQAHSCSGVISSHRAGPHLPSARPRATSMLPTRPWTPWRQGAGLTHLCCRWPLRASKGPCSVSSRWTEDGPNPGVPPPMSARLPAPQPAVASHPGPHTVSSLRLGGASWDRVET